MEEGKMYSDQMPSAPRLTAKKRIGKLKKCKEVIDGGLSDVAILTQELVIIKQDLMKIQELDSFNEGRVTTVLRKLPETKKNQFLDIIKDMEYKALKVSYGLG